MDEWMMFSIGVHGNMSVKLCLNSKGIIDLGLP